MKIASILLLAALSVIDNASAESPEITILIARRNAAIEKVEDTYRAELEKLRARYVSAGNSSGVEEVAALLNANTSVATKDEPSGAKEKSPLGAPDLEGKWRFTSPFYPSGVRSFSGGIMKDEAGDPHRWSFKDGYITVDFGNNRWEKFKYDPQNQNVLEGVNHRDHTLTLSRVNKAPSR